jgi:hypothetical protein
MAETATQGVISEQTQQEVKQETKEAEVKQEVQEVKEDLVSRASKVKLEEKKETNPFGLTKDDYDKVQTDPTLSKFYKSMLSDYTRKTQNLSEKEREVERIKLESSNWTPEKIQQLLNDQKFVQAAQQVASLSNPPNSGLSDQEYSALTDKEKAQFHSMQKQLSEIQMQNWQMHQRQQDEVLKTKYANYAPDIVDVTIHKLVKGEVKADREVVWKALDYDEAVKRAYELGKQDRALDTKVKTQSMSVEGFTATPQNEMQPEKGETNSAYWKRIATQRMTELKGRNT